MIRLCLAALAALAAPVLAAPVLAADLGAPSPAGRSLPGKFLATCEDLGHFCAAEACGRDQIAAAEGCRALCPGSVVLAVVPAACPLPAPRVVLRRRG